MKQQVTRDEAMKLIGKNIVAIKKDGTRVTGKLLKVSGNKLVLKRLNGKKYVQKRFCHWYCLICSLLPHCLMLMEVVPASVPDMDLDQNQALDMVQATDRDMDLEDLVADMDLVLDSALMVQVHAHQDFSRTFYNVFSNS